MTNATTGATRRLSLRRAVVLVLLGGVCAWIAASFAIARSILVDSMVEHELEDGRAHGQRILRLVDAELARLDRTARDWSAWDETYAFARGDDPGFVVRNVYDEVLTNLELDLMAFVGADATLRLLRMRAGAVPPPAPIPTLLAADGAWLEAHRTNRPLLGLVSTARGPLAFAAHPIHRSKAAPAEASAGTQVFGRLLDASFVGELRSTLHLELSLHVLDGTQADDVRDAVRQAGDGNLHVALRDAQHLATYVLLRDLWGQPAAVMRAITSRTAYAQARRAERGLLLASLAIGIAAGIGLYAFMARRVLAPLHALDAAVLDVARDGGAARLPPSRVDDEFARLGQSVNAMLDELDAQRDAREARDAAQLASRLKGELLMHLGAASAQPLRELRETLERALRADDLPPATRVTLERAYRAAFTLATELHGLPALARDARAEDTSAGAGFDLCELLESFADGAAARAATRGRDFVSDIDPALGCTYLGDPSRLQSVLSMMVDHLATALPAAGLLLRARLAATGDPDDSIEVAVCVQTDVDAAPDTPHARPAGDERQHDGVLRLQQAANALGALPLFAAGLRQLTLRLTRVGPPPGPSPRPCAGARALLLGPASTARDVTEAYLKSLGCSVTAIEEVTPTTPRDPDFAVALVPVPLPGATLSPPLPGVPVVFLLPAGVPPPMAEPGCQCLHRPVRWRALQAVLARLQRSGE